MSLAAISTDDMAMAAGMVELVGVEFPVLADENKLVTREYRVYNLLDDGVAAPATFIISPSGSVLWKHVAEHIADRPTPDQILAEVDRLIR